MFQFSRLALFRVLCLQHSGLSHSEIFGLSVVCTYPKLIAAYHVLHRLSMPRHPPYALIRFKYCMFRLIPVCGLIPDNCFFTLLLVLLPDIATCWRTNCFPNMSKNFSWSTKYQVLSIKTVMCMDLNHLLRCPSATSYLLSLPLLYPGLHYSTLSREKKWRISESNRWPPACKAGALASWANPPFLQ